MGKKSETKKVLLTPDLHWNGRPDFVLMSKGQHDAYMKIMNPTHGMNKKEKRLYKLLYEE